MKNLFLILTVLFSSGIVLSQKSATIKFPADRLSAVNPDIDTLSGIKNKPVLFESDTVFIINRKGISQYLYSVNQLKKLRNLVIPVSGIEGNLSGIRSGLNRLDSVQTDFSSFLEDYQEKNRINLLQLSRENSQLNKQLNEIDQNLKKTETLIENAKNEQIRSNLLWGGGGLLVGALLTLLLL